MPNTPAADFWRNSRRPLAPGEFDPERLWLILFPVLALVAAVWLMAGFPTPKCALHEWTGIPCPTCGSTRAVAALLAGDLGTALRWNPLTLVTLASFTIAWFYSAVVCLTGSRRFRPPVSRNAGIAIRVAFAALLLLNWLYLIFTIP